MLSVFYDVLRQAPDIRFSSLDQ